MNEQVNLRSGITGRWFRTTLLVVMAIVLFSFFIGYLLLRNNYQSTAELRLTSEYSDSVETYFVSAYQANGEAGFNEAAREYIESFGEKDIMDVWILDGEGNVLMSSSGFTAPDEKMPDYNAALRSSAKTGTWKGRTRSGESVSAVTHLLESSGNRFGAVRYIMSMRGINKQMLLLAMALFIAFLLVMGLVILSSYFFISSIVRPVREINEVTKRIAAGDMAARLAPQDHNDEISELCENINYMADELSSTDKMKNDFISTVSHEMKTPLTAIKGWAETLSSGDMDPALFKRGMEIIIDESSRLTNVVNDLLDLSKIAGGRLTLRYEKIDILAELDETIFLFKDRSMREGIELVYNAPHIPAPAEGDPVRIKQVFENVLDNAFKYNTQGGKVTVAADLIPPKTDGEKATLKIFVEDTGCGISREELPNVKKKFYKSNLSVPGSGIGLAVCDEIIKMHKGTLELESEVGTGTLVIITMPVDYVKLDTELPEATVQMSRIETEKDSIGNEKA